MTSLSPEVSAALALCPFADSLDEAVMTKLARAQPERAVEIIEEITDKQDLRNPSAFVSKALDKFPSKRGGGKDISFEEIFDKYPHLANSIDDRALNDLKHADPDRAMEVIDELAAKDDVRNPSAFVVTALDKFPRKRGRQQDVQQVLETNPSLKEMLDEVALESLNKCDPARAVEILEDLLSKTDVRNPSAFVSTALRAHPKMRGDAGGASNSWGASWMAPVAYPYGGKYGNGGKFGGKGSHVSFGGYGGYGGYGGGKGGSKDPMSQLDAEAHRRLSEAHPARAEEILAELAQMGSQVHNPSAFVCKALATHPQVRGRNHSISLGGPMQFQPMLNKRPLLASALAPLNNPFKKPRKSDPAEDLDDMAQSKLQAADPERANEILEELRDKGSAIRNPSAFVCKALQQYPQPRGRTHR